MSTPYGIQISENCLLCKLRQLIGTSHETVTRVLSEFRQKKLAQLRGSTLLILNKSGMEKLIET